MQHSPRNPTEPQPPSWRLLVLPCEDEFPHAGHRWHPKNRLMDRWCPGHMSRWVTGIDDRAL